MLFCWKHPAADVTPVTSVSRCNDMGSAQRDRLQHSEGDLNGLNGAYGFAHNQNSIYSVTD